MIYKINKQTAISYIEEVDDNEILISLIKELENIKQDIPFIKKVRFFIRDEDKFLNFLIKYNIKIDEMLQSLIRLFPHIWKKNLIQFVRTKYLNKKIIKKSKVKKKKKLKNKNVSKP